MRRAEKIQMGDIFTIAEETLIARQKLPPSLGFDKVRPSYDGLGLANIAALVLSWLCPETLNLGEPKALLPFNPELLAIPTVTDAWRNWLNQAPINHVVMLIVDALGYDQLRTLIDEGDVPGLASACVSPQAFFMPATSVFPTTTVTALTSAATAHAPAQHGIMGTKVYFREVGSVVNILGFRPAIAPTNSPYLDTQLNPDTLLPVPNLYHLLEQAGIDVEIVNFYQYKHSSISRFTSVGSQAGTDGYISYLTPADGFAQLRERLQKRSSYKSFTYLYVPNVDSAAHRFGPLSSCYRAEVAALDFSLQRELLRPLAGRSDTILLIVADHGQRYIDPEKILWLGEHPTLTQSLFVPPQAGVSSARFLHLINHAEAAVVDYVQKHLAEFLVVSKAEAIELGLFGLPEQPTAVESVHRIGDLILMPRHDWACFYGNRHSTSIGIHGGLSRAEMLIPFLAYRF